MKLEQSFDVQAPVAAVWGALLDVPRVAGCLPGADITEAGEDRTYSGTFKVKLGPTTAEYRGSIRMEDLDEAGHVATMRAEGSDKRGQGGAKATIVSRLTEQERGTRVDVDTDFSITGRLARFGRGGMIQDVSNRLLREFASCLQDQLGETSAGEADPDPVPAGEVSSVEAEDADTQGNGRVSAGKAPGEIPPPPPRPESAPAREPLDAGSLVGGVLAARAKEAAPIALLALLVGFLLGRRSGLGFPR